MSISFYAANAGSNGGAYQIDNVSLRAAPTAVAAETRCIDPWYLPYDTTPDFPEMLGNASFGNGTLPPWQTFGTRARSGWRPASRSSPMRCAPTSQRPGATPRSRSIYAASVGTQPWTRVDNASLKWTPSTPNYGVDCGEPGSAVVAGRAPLFMNTFGFGAAMQR